MARLSIQQRLSSNVKKFRKQKGLSQERLANTSGVARSYIGGIERAERNPSITTLNKLAKALSVSADKLIGK